METSSTRYSLHIFECPWISIERSTILSGICIKIICSNPCAAIFAEIAAQVCDRGNTKKFNSFNGGKECRRIVDKAIICSTNNTDCNVKGAVRFVKSRELFNTVFKFAKLIIPMATIPIKFNLPKPLTILTCNNLIALHFVAVELNRSHTTAKLIGWRASGYHFQRRSSFAKHLNRMLINRSRYYFQPQQQRKWKCNYLADQIWSWTHCDDGNFNHSRAKCTRRFITLFNMRSSTQWRCCEHFFSVKMKKYFVIFQLWIAWHAHWMKPG